MIRKALFVLLLLAPATTAQEKKDPLHQRLAALAAHLEEKAPAEVKQDARLALRERSALLADTALAKAFPTYGKALDRLGRGDPEGVERMARMAEAGPDPYVRLHARYHLGRFLLDGGDPEGAIKPFYDFFAGKSALSPFEPEAAFFLGIALSRIPSREEAINVLTNFLKNFPWAPERYRAVAFQVLEELKRPDANPIHGVADEMDAVKRKLKKGDPGEKTVKQEKEILEKLDKLIEEMEKKEKKNKGKDGGGGGSTPKQDSSTGKGKAELGPLHQAARKLASRWAALPRKERERVLQDLKRRFPPRYRALLEAYFKKLSSKK